MPEGDRKESVPEGDRKESVPEGDNLYKVMPRFGTNRHGIFELENNKIGRSLDVFLRKRGVTSLKDWLGAMTGEKVQKIGMTVLIMCTRMRVLCAPKTSTATIYQSVAS